LLIIFTDKPCYTIIIRSKYLLAITTHLLNILGEIAIGYDIGCKFAKMVKVHLALKELARDKSFRALVGTFHGHGHNRLCSLDNLMTYVEGSGSRLWKPASRSYRSQMCLPPPPVMQADSIASRQ
jgi:hypothetical protein